MGKVSEMTTPDILAAAERYRKHWKMEERWCEIVVNRLRQGVLDLAG